jgi:hypothetical protein
MPWDQMHSWQMCTLLKLCKYFRSSDQPGVADMIYVLWSADPHTVVGLISQEIIYLSFTSQTKAAEGLIINVLHYRYSG